MAKLKRYASFDALKSDATSDGMPAPEREKLLSEFESFVGLVRKSLIDKGQPEKKHGK